MAKQKSWFQAVVALYRLALDWSLDSVILGKAVELTKGLDSDDRMMDDGEATHNLQKIVLFSLCHLFWKTPITAHMIW